MATTTTTLIFSLLAILSVTTTVTTAHNITNILASDPNLSDFNTYLTKTKLADEINARKTITVLALTNSAMHSLTDNHPLSAIKNILSLHILLDYYDGKKLHSIPDGRQSATSLYQTTGQKGQLGEVNITDQRGGSVGFGPGPAGKRPTYVKEVKTMPYSLSVLEISAPIMVPELLTSGSGDVNVTAVLEKAGCKTFAALVSQSGVLKTYQSQMSDGITIFAPNDEAFKAKGVPDVSKLTNAELVALLQFHALTSYAPRGTLKNTKGNLQTLAPAGKYGLTTTTDGDTVKLHTGVSSSRLAQDLLDAPPVMIYSVDDLLLPQALFAGSPAPAPAPESDAPTPAPAKAPKADSPSPSDAPTASPPAPPTETPSDSPADAPGPVADDNGGDKKKNGGVRGNGSVFMAVVVSVVSGVICLLL